MSREAARKRPRKSREAAPWFGFYPRAFLDGTATFTNEEKGIYITLLCHQWFGPLPAERVYLLVNLATKTPQLSHVLTKFRRVKGHLLNDRLEAERKITNDYRDSQSAKALRRWQCRGIPGAVPVDMPQSNKQTNIHLKDLIDNQSGFVATKIANQIVANETGWSYDNCKVDPAHLKISSLKTVILPFTGRFKERQIIQEWHKAVRIAHAAAVDGLAKNATAYAVECFKRQLENSGKGNQCEPPR